MTETKKIFIKSLISGLKIDVEGNPFEYQAVVDGVEFINECDFMDFYNEARKINTYGDGVKAIIETAELFKPQSLEIDQVEIKAKELIELVHAMNYTIEKEHAKTGIDFNTLLDDVIFTALSEEDEQILNNVSPCFNMKLLIAKDNLGWGTIEQLQAYKNAIRNGATQIANTRLNKMIKGKEDESKCNYGLQRATAKRRTLLTR